MAVDKRKNVAVFPVTLWTDRLHSRFTVSYFTFPNMDVKGVRGQNELLKWIWRDVRDDTLNAVQMHKGYDQSTEWKPNCKFLRAIPAFLNVPHIEACILLWFSGHSSLVTILLKLLCTAAYSLSTARHCLLAVQTRHHQELQHSQDSVFSSDSGKLESDNSASAARLPACFQASDLKEMGVLTDCGTRGYINKSNLRKYGRGTC